MEQAKPVHVPKQGWLDWVTGRVPVEDMEDLEDLHMPQDWTEEERQQLYAEIGLDTEEEAMLNQVPGHGGDGRVGGGEERND